MSIRTADYWKQRLALTSHPEGGAFSEVYRSGLVIPQAQIGGGFKGDRNISTSIYFLLQHGEFSAFHRIASDELWHFYDGVTLSIYEIREGQLHKHLLGLDFEAGARPQVLISAGSWFASVVEIENGFTLCGCTVSPGFDFEDFEMADRALLTQEFPIHQEIIHYLTHP